ncbi:MAG: DUF4139 domain-containing protein [Planctomycetota bacterium]|nr:MAG: DUF4139 domain-containing protein [Planctomycetota bacterium]
MRTKETIQIIGVFLLLVSSASAGSPALTVYNQDFAVVRDTIDLDLKQGVNEIRFTETTAHLEPDSVILRDPAGKHALQILEQNYRADPVTEQLLLSLYEGKTIEFEVRYQDHISVVKGKIIRSGYVPHQSGLRSYGRQYRETQMAYASASGQPIIEVDGKLQFRLPGIPLFPALADDTILKPTLHWLINTSAAGTVNAEIAYITGGMSWEADYNIVAPEKGDVLDLIGWVTIDNQSGKTFKEATIKLMAGDVSKIQPEEEYRMVRAKAMDMAEAMAPTVTEKTFDEYHLYTLSRPTTLRDRETKQVEFVRAAGVKSQRLYIYDGARIDRRFRGYNMENLRYEREYGTKSNPKIWVMREFKNSEDNNLGVPLPRGRVRFYRQDDDGQMEFTGENIIDHTPRDELIRVYTGNAFDLVGERKRTHFETNRDRRYTNESFEIKVRNHKKEEVEVRIVEHLYRWFNWELLRKSDPFIKTDSQTIEFRVKIPADGEKTVTYTVHYTW